MEIIKTAKRYVDYTPEELYHLTRSRDIKPMKELGTDEVTVIDYVITGDEEGNKVTAVKFEDGWVYATNGKPFNDEFEFITSVFPVPFAMTIDKIKSKNGREYRFPINPHSI